MISQGRAGDDRCYEKKKQKVFVGLSGGVDSAVSAALLKKAGYDVTGVLIKVWQPDWIECTWRDDRRSAMRVAAHLGLPFVTLDLEKEYKSGVIDVMIAGYTAGHTPNPDVMCNREVKFGAFWKWAKGEGADAIATGHYARIKPGETFDDGASPRLCLYAGSDPNKDQSYFLWTLTPDDLEHILFPVGDLTKPEVRRLARKFGLPNAEKKDSQGLCFIGQVDVKGFLAHYVGDLPATHPGDVLDLDGRKIGTHPGALFFTIGERHGFMIDPRFKTPDDTRLYVIAKNMDANTITVTKKDEMLTSSMKQVHIASVSWVAGRAPEPGVKLRARARYRQPLQDLEMVTTAGTDATISFLEPQTALAKGQSLVIYNGDECLGGGVIESTF